MTPAVQQFTAWRRTKTFKRLFDELPAEVQASSDRMYAAWKRDPSSVILRSYSSIKRPNWFRAELGRTHRAIGQRKPDGTLVWVWCGPHEKYNSVYTRVISECAKRGLWRSGTGMHNSTANGMLGFEDPWFRSGGVLQDAQDVDQSDKSTPEQFDRVIAELTGGDTEPAEPFSAPAGV